MNKINIIYIRTSSKEQNPDLQLSDCKSLLSENYEVYKEQQSAYKDFIKQRPIFSEILKLIKEDKVNSVNVWDLDRLYRNRVAIANFMNMCLSKGIIVRSYRQPYISEFEKFSKQIPQDNPMAWFMKDMIENMRQTIIKVFGYMAEEESRKKGERVKMAVRKGEGITLSYNGKKWGRKAISKQTIDRVRQIRFDNPHWSIRKIAKEIYYFDKNNNKRLLSKSVVHKILSEFDSQKVNRKVISP